VHRLKAVLAVGGVGCMFPQTSPVSCEHKRAKLIWLKDLVFAGHICLHCRHKTGFPQTVCKVWYALRGLARCVYHYYPIWLWGSKLIVGLLVRRKQSLSWGVQTRFGARLNGFLCLMIQSELDGRLH